MGAFFDSAFHERHMKSVHKRDESQYSLSAFGTCVGPRFGQFLRATEYEPNSPRGEAELAESAKVYTPVVDGTTPGWLPCIFSPAGILRQPSRTSSL